MGKPDDDLPAPSPNPPPALGEGSSAISLDTTSELPIQRYFDDEPGDNENDDLPPLYSDIEGSAGPRTAPINPLIPTRFGNPQVAPFYKGSNEATTCYLDKRLDTDPVFLQQQIKSFAAIPPRPFVKIEGKHRESSKRNGKSESTEVIDFDVEIELTPLLFENILAQRSWRELQTVGNFEKVKRGTVFATRAPGFGGSGVAEETIPGVEEWCHRYCASHAGLKKFVFRRRITGWDWDLVESKLRNLVWATNYRGHLQITFPVKDQSVEIYNDCRVNRWRLTRWIELLCYFTFLWLITWPLLFFGTKSFETVVAVWPVSKVENGSKQYASISEERWYNVWARPIQRAILDRHQGQLDQSHLRTVAREPPRAEGIAGVVQAGVEAMGVVNRSFGWGMDT